MSTPNFFSNNVVLNNNIKIDSQYVKFIHFYTPLGQDFDFNSENIEFDLKFDVFENKNDSKNYILIVEFFINEVNPKEKEDDCMLNIIVEGIYSIEEEIEDDEEINVHFGSLNLLISYLRVVLFNITSMTANGGLHLPLINVKELFLKKFEKDKKKLKNKKKLKS